MFPTRPLILGLLVAVFFSAATFPTPSAADPVGRNLSCVGLDPPGDGVIINRFEPGPGYSGHWGIDYTDDSDGYAQAAAGGRVAFVGEVAGNLAVTVDHGGGLKTSYSYLDLATVDEGRRVTRGTMVGRIGAEPSHDGLHFSVRIKGTYIDPEAVLGCLPRSPSEGLRLVPVHRRRM